MQVEQSDMLWELNIAKMAKEGFSRAAIEETKYQFKRPGEQVRKGNQPTVEFPDHQKATSANIRH